MATLREWMRRLLGTLRKNPRDGNGRRAPVASRAGPEDMERRGQSTEGAARAARLQVGSVAQAMEAMRDQRGLPWLDDLMRDVRHAPAIASAQSGLHRSHAADTLARNRRQHRDVQCAECRSVPAASVSIAGAVGDVVDRGSESEPSRGQIGLSECRTVAEPKPELRGHGRLRSCLATLTARGRGGTDQSSRGSHLTSFRCSAFSPCMGRSFSREEAEQRQRAGLISHRFWQTRFGGSHDAIGASIELDGVPSRIIGILPAASRLRGLMQMCGSRTRCFRIGRVRRAAPGGDSWFVVGKTSTERDVRAGPGGDERDRAPSRRSVAGG